MDADRPLVESLESTNMILMVSFVYISTLPPLV